MPTTPHIEKHFTASATVRDIVIGMSDGLTVPFALAAGLTGAIAATGIVVTAGLAEISAGCIAMGLGGYLAARGDREHYESELAREEWEIDNLPDREENEVAEILETYGLTPEQSATVVAGMRQRRQAWIDFMMKFELGLDKPDPRRAYSSAATIGGAYAVGGLIPLAPYMLLSNIQNALVVSIIITLATLLIFGYVKGHFTGTQPWRSALQTMFIGGAAAATAFAVARTLSGA